MADSLGAYLESLGKVENLEAPHPFPSHRRVMGTIKERVKALREHHERRIAEALRIVTEKPGLTPYEIAGRMQWKIRSRNWEEFPLAQNSLPSAKLSPTWTTFACGGRWFVKR